MMSYFLRLLKPNDESPVTHNDVEPEARDPVKEREAKTETAKLVSGVMAVERKAWEVRQELATNTIRLVAGDR